MKQENEDMTDNFTNSVYTEKTDAIIPVPNQQTQTFVVGARAHCQSPKIM